MRNLVAFSLIAMCALALGGASSAHKAPPEPAAPPARIVYEWGVSSGSAEIFIINADGSGNTRLTNNGSDDREPTWSPDGSQIAFSASRNNSTTNIFRMNPDGTNQVPVTNSAAPEFNSGPDWSPDAQRFAFISNRAGTGRNEIWLIGADGSNPQRLTVNTQFGQDISGPYYNRDADPVWSPDGTRIAFSSNRVALNNQEIYVMNADGTNVVRLTNAPGNDNSPAWSPDGTRLAFGSFRDGNFEVYVMNADGSAQTNITNASPASDGYPAWSPDGTTFAFIRHTGGPGLNEAFELYRMNIDGSGQTKLTNNAPSDSRAPVWERSGGPAPPPPPPAPGYRLRGRVLSYSQTPFGTGVAGVTMELSGALSATTQTDAGGNYLFGSIPANSTFTVRPRTTTYGYSPSSQTVSTGPPVDAFGNGTKTADFSASPISLQFISSTEFALEGQGQRFISVTRDGFTTGESTIDYATSDGTAVAGSDYSHVSGTLRFAPGEGMKSIAVPIINDTLVEPDETINITLSNPTGAFLGAPSTTVLTIGANDAPTPTPTPSPTPVPTPTPAPLQPNDKIAFTSNRDGAASEVYVMNPDGTGQTNLTKYGGEDFHPVWSPDATKIAYQTVRDGGLGSFIIHGIAVMNADGTGQTLLTNDQAGGFHPTWSPDGVKIAFDRAVNGNSDIYVMNADGTNVVRLTTSTASDNSPAWSPDGTKIAFTSFQPGTPGSNIYVMNADGTNVVRLTNNDTEDLTPAWSPDGTKIAFSSNRAGPFHNYDIYVMGADGGGVTRLTDHPTRDSRPAWSRDGARIAFDRTSDAGFNTDIFVMNADGSNAVQLTTHSAHDSGPNWQPLFTAAPVSSTVQFGATGRTAFENGPSVALSVTRLGNTSGTATVNYATLDGTAQDRSDYTAAFGTITFAPGEGTKHLTVFITDDVHLEADESFEVVLTDPSGAALGAQNRVSVGILNNDFGSPPNPVRDATFNAAFFVRQHYLDFLNREPDASGLAFWRNQITECEGRPEAERQGCREVRRINVSASFFLSIEFQETGYLVYRTYGAAFGTTRVGGVVPLTLREFLPDTQETSRGVVIGQPGAEALLEANKVAYFDRFVQRPQFSAAYPESMTATQFVNALNSNASGSLTPGEAAQLAGELGANSKTRAQVLRSVAENATFRQRELNRAFVLMQYFGYLRRNPSDAPEPSLNFDGYNFWLGKLNGFGGNFVAAEMVKAFITSGEFQQRFGP